MVDLENLISNNFRTFQATVDEHGNGPLLFRRADLIPEIERWTNILQSSSLPQNPKIGIVHELNFRYVCIIYACINIGANFVVLSGRFDNNSSHKSFLPLDLVIYDYTLIDTFSGGLEYMENNSNKLINVEKLPSYNQHVAPDFNLLHTTILSSTTSGTTSTPKQISHSYEYILDIAQRNINVFKFSGKVAQLKNLYHGSSLPVFFLPTVMACNMHVCSAYPNTEYMNRQDIKLFITQNMLPWFEYIDVNHILLPYTDLVEHLLTCINNTNSYFSNLTLYTLSYIRPEWKDLIRNRNIKIISVYGCTETSGPIFINQLDSSNLDNFDNKVFYLPDDFFQVILTDYGTIVKAKNHSVTHTMNDLFEHIGEHKYKHLGRSDICRINDISINQQQLLDLASDLGIDGQLVIDKDLEKIYLAIWNKDVIISYCKDKINQALLDLYGKTIQITKCNTLDKNLYITGIKLNHELLRTHFRNYV
jgi:hypothetical protein